MPDAIVLTRVSGGAIDGRLRAVRVRQHLFQSLHTALLKHRDALLEATQADDCCTKAEAQAVLASALIDVRNHYDLLDFEKELDSEYSLARGKNNEQRRTPIPLAYIIPNSLNLLFNVISALGAALEAGSCVVTELERTVEKTPSILSQLISESLDQEAVGVVSSRAPREFLARCVVVDQKPVNKNDFSAERLLSSPEYRNLALVDRTGDAKLAAKEIVASRLMFGGASSYAVDLVLVNEFVEAALREALIKGLAVDRSRQWGPQIEPQLMRRAILADGTEPALYDKQVEGAAASFVQGDSSAGLLQVFDRSCPVVCQKLLGSRVVVSTSVTSLDDMIDFVCTEPQQKARVGSLYIFSKAREAKYLSQHIDTRATYVNHIPAQLSIGPMAPIDYPTSLATRYTRVMFENPSPEVVPGLRSHLVSCLLEKAASFDQVAQKPLEPTGQPESGAWGFFEQGIVLGAVVYILPMLGVMTFGMGYAGWTGYLTWSALR